MTTSVVVTIGRLEKTGVGKRVKLLKRFLPEVFWMNDADDIFEANLTKPFVHNSRRK